MERSADSLRAESEGSNIPTSWVVLTIQCRGCEPCIWQQVGHPMFQPAIQCSFAIDQMAIAMFHRANNPAHSTLLSFCSQLMTGLAPRMYTVLDCDTSTFPETLKLPKRSKKLKKTETYIELLNSTNPKNVPGLLIQMMMVMLTRHMIERQEQTGQAGSIQGLISEG